MSGDLLYFAETVLRWSVLISLPGAWVTFSLPLRDLSLWVRILIGISLTPFVVFIEFYLLRITGLSFESTCSLLVLVNLPAGYLVYKRARSTSFPCAKTMFAAAATLAIPLALIWPQVMDVRSRIFTGHAWMQSDIIYMLADGKMLLEEPELAGIRLCYPYAAHPFQAVLSFLAQSAPAVSYLWTNLVWLVVIFGILAHIVSEMGGTRFAQITSLLWLCFGVNFAGYVLFTMVPGAASGAFWEHGAYSYSWIGGDYRVTPWMLKYFFFEQCVLGITLLASVVLVLIKWIHRSLNWDLLVLLGILLCGIGYIYPVFLAPAIIATCCFSVARYFEKGQSQFESFFSQSLKIGAVTLVSVILTYAYLKVLTADRTTPSLILPTLSSSFVRHAAIKSVGGIVTLAVLLAGLGFVFVRSWKSHRSATLILCGGGLGSALLYVLLEIPKPSAEYKFLLTAGLFLSPFPALASALIADGSNRRKVLAFIIIAAVLSASAAHKVYTDFPWSPPWIHIGAEPSGFDLKIDRSDPMAAIVEAIRVNTPPETVVVAERASFHLPTVARRSLFAPPLQELPHAGVFIVSNTLLSTMKGYGNGIVDRRRSIVNRLFHSENENLRSLALAEMLDLNRPVAIILENRKDADLKNWLQSDVSNLNLFDDGERSLWIVRPDEPADR